MIIRMINELCPKCNNNLYKGDCVVNGYYATCLACDEDFYKFEVRKRRGKNQKVYKVTTTCYIASIATYTRC